MRFVESWKRNHLYYLLIFAFLYMSVSLFYYLYFVTLHIGLQGIATKLFVTITSPFGPLENLSNIYTSINQGLLLNLIFLLAIIFFSEIVYQYTKNIKKYLHLPENILIGIVASYITAIIFWYYTGTPSSGTSIVGVNLLTFSLLCIILDVPTKITQLKDSITSKNKRFYVIYSLTLVLYLLAFILIYALYASYGYRLTHLIGGIIGLILFIALVTFRFYNRR
jgi:hypothetical protein